MQCPARCRLAIATLAIAFHVVLGSSLRAQEHGPFDPDAELPGLAEMRGWHQAWMLKPFLASRGKRLAPAERAALVADWRRAKPAVEARHAAAASDPFLARVDHTRTSLANEPFYAGLHYRVREETRPFALFIEVPGRNDTEDELRASRIAKAYAPFLAAFQAKLDADIAPLAGGPPAANYVVWILLDDASYQRFFRAHGEGAGVLGVRAHYSTRQRFAFTWSPGATAGPEFHEGVQTLLHELTHAYLDALSKGGLASIGLHWVNEGLPEYLSCFKRGADAIVFDPLWSQRVMETLRTVRLDTGDLRIDVADWLAAPDGAAVARLAVRVGRQRLGTADDELVAFLMSRFYADAYLFVLWLHETRGGLYRERFREHLAQELRGAGGPDAFRARFADVLALPLDAELELYARELLEKRVPWLAEPPGGAASGAAGTATAEPAANRFDPVTSAAGLVAAAGVALPAATQRALRWQRFLGAGLRVVPGAFEDDRGDAELAALVERELDALFAKLVRSGAVVLLDEAAKGKVAAADARCVVVESGGRRVELPRAQLSPARLAYVVRTNADKSDAASATAALLELLGGDAKRAREAAKRVAGAPAKLLEPLLAAGDALAAELSAAAALERIVQAGPADLEAAAAAAWPQLRGTPLGAACGEALRGLVAERLAPALAGAALFESLTTARVKELPAGPATPPAGARVELEWTFDASEQAGDFTPREWPALVQQVAQAVGEKLPPSTAWKVTGGRLHPAPGGALVFALPFAAGSEIELDFALSELATQQRYAGSQLWFGLAAEESGDFVLFDGLSHCEVASGSFGDAARLPAPKQLDAGATWRAKLEFGARQTVAHRGSDTTKVTYPFERPARLLLAGVAEQCWEVDRLVLRANVPPAALARLRRDAAVRLAATLLSE